MRSHETVGQLKLKIEDKQGVPAGSVPLQCDDLTISDAQRLLFSQKQLDDDDKTLGEIGISKESTIFLVLKVWLLWP